MRDSTVYWMWAQRAFGCGSSAPWRVHNTYPGGLEGFYSAGPAEWSKLRYVTKRHIETMERFTIARARTALEYATRLGWQALTPECEKYPQALRNISDPPAVLYVQGRMPGPDQGPLIAIAGAREATRSTLEAVGSISQQLAAKGAVIVSGDARGVDSCAIGGAHSACGQVVSFRVVDLLSAYPSKSANMRQEILDFGGTLVSEYFSQSTPTRGAFHERNRLITGISDGVLLFQAAMRSGTMIYGRAALKQKKRLFVYPGPPGDPGYEGSRELIRLGAIPVYTSEDVMKALEGGKTGRASQAAYPVPAEPAAPTPAAAPEEPVDLPEPERPVPVPAAAQDLVAVRGAVYTPELRLVEPPRQNQVEVLMEAMEAELDRRQLMVSQPDLKAMDLESMVSTTLKSGEKTLDELADICGRDPNDVMRVLTAMELMGRVERVSGTRFRLARRR